MPIWYANPTPTFQPAMRLIDDITKAKEAVVTTSFDHDYQTGMIVRIYVPRNYGMFQIDDKYGPITVLTDDTFSIEIDTTAYDSFLAPSVPPYYHKTSLCIPIGNVNNSYNLAVENVT